MCTSNTARLACARLISLMLSEYHVQEYSYTRLRSKGIKLGDATVIDATEDLQAVMNRNDGYAELGIQPGG